MLSVYGSLSGDGSIQLADPITIVYIAVVVGLSLLSSYLFRPRNKTTISEDDQVRALSTRGSYTPYVMGRRRTGAVIAFVGDTTRSSSGGGSSKGGGGGETTIYLESAWHILHGPGPAKALYNIREDGKIIWEGPITPHSHPSGTVIPTGMWQDQFIIYWGEPNQPTNSFLVTAIEREFGTIDPVVSRWPLATSVFWLKKRLGATNRWPQMEYEIETGIRQPVLFHSTPNVPEQTDLGVGIPNVPTGINAAHALYQVLFDKWPYGRASDKSEWDLDSFEDLGVLLHNEKLPQSFAAREGVALEVIVGQILQDAGCVLPMDPITGKYTLVPLRPLPEGSVPPFVTKDMIQAYKDPEIDIVLDDAETLSDRLVFQFFNSVRQFRIDTIPQFSDGQSFLKGYQKDRLVEISTATDRRTAGIIAERRSQEELVGGADTIKIEANRETRHLKAGDPLVAEDIGPGLRVVKRRCDPNTNKTTLDVVEDTFNIDKSTFNHNEGGDRPTDETLAPSTFDFFEVPAYWTQGEFVIAVPIIRATGGALSHNVWLSRDNSSYTQVLDGVFHQTGGTLIEPMFESGPTELENGPLYQAIGPDNTFIDNLTGQDVEWRMGRQWAVITDGVDQELCFIRNVDMIDSQRFRLRGVIRARYQTSKKTWPINSKVFIFRRDRIPPILNDFFLMPGQPLFVKAQPVGRNPIPLSEIAPVLRTLYGYGIVPMDTTVPLVTNNSLTYKSGDDIEIKWGYQAGDQPFKRRTGAGLQGAGDPTINAPPDGSFTIAFRELPDPIVRTVSGLLTPEYTYSNADILADFGGEPSSIRVLVFNVNNGYTSQQMVADIVKVS